MWMFLFITGTFLCLFIGWKITKMKNFDWDEDIFLPCVVISFILAGTILGIVSAFVIIEQTMDIITCLTYPEKIIIEIVQSIV